MRYCLKVPKGQLEMLSRQVNKASLSHNINFIDGEVRILKQYVVGGLSSDKVQQTPTQLHHKSFTLTYLFVKNPQKFSIIALA